MKMSGPPFSTYKGGITKFIKLSIYPLTQIQGITFFPPYKNSSPNLTNKRKGIQQINERDRDRPSSSQPLPPKYNTPPNGYSTTLSPLGCP